MRSGVKANMATPSARILRVGIIQGGKIIEERHFTKPATVSIGQDSRSTFVLPGTSLPASVDIFDFRNGQYALLFTDAMEGRIRSGTADLDFAGLKAQGTAKKVGAAWALPLTGDSKGKVSVGDVTLLFQFVAPPPEPVRVALPETIQGNFWQSVDRVFFSILAISMIIHISGASCIALTPMPPEPELTLDQLPDRFARLLIPPTPPAPEKVVETKPGKEDSKEKADTAPKKDTTPKDTAQRKAEVQQKVASRGLLKILGSQGQGGALADVLGSSGGTNDIASALAGAGGVGVATSDAVAGGQKGGGTGNVAGIGDLGTSGGGNVNLGEKKEVAVSGRVRDAAPEVESSTVDREAVTRYVRARLTAIKNCYEKELKRNTQLKGKVVVRFTITPAGRTGDIEIEENTVGNEAVAACIRTVIRSWIFPFKPDDEVPVSYPFLFSPTG